jgi:acyl carrier protein
MSNSRLDEVCAILAVVMQCNPAELSVESSHENVSGWDSLRHVELVEVLTEQFGVAIDAEAIKMCVSVRGILRVLESRTAFWDDAVGE